MKKNLFLNRVRGYLALNSKAFRVMRLTFYLLLLTIFQGIAANSYSQNTKLSFKLNDVKVKDVLNVIEEKSEFYFLFNSKLVDVERMVDINVSNQQVDKILSSLFSGTNVGFTVMDRQIILQPIVEVSELTTSMQQQIKVTGKITDATNGETLPGVNIVVKGTTSGTLTDMDGVYSINVTGRKTTLIFSFVGYNSQEIVVGDKTVIDIALKATMTDLDEVVVVGYGTQKRTSVVGAVASVGGEKLTTVPAMNVSNAISGMIPGATIMQTQGEPGQGTPRIQIRGRTTMNTDGSTTRLSSDAAIAPQVLVVIDGVPGRSMDEIDPNDIESLSVLKDASAAIYGAQAANGVILIKTKSGKEGKPRLNYQFYQGFMTPTLTPEVCNASEYATMLSEYQVYEGKARTYTDSDIELYKNGKDPWGHPNTNWYGELIKDWTSTSKHNVTLDGGAKGMNYYVSFGYKTDDAMYKASSTKYKQYNVRTKLDMPVTDWLKTGVELAGFLNDRVYPYKSADAIVGQSTRLTPTTWAYWPTGEPGPDIEYGDNPVVTSTFAGGKNDQKTYRLLSTFNATVTVPFVKGLSFTGSYNYDLTNYYQKAFYKPWILYYPNWSEATRNSDGYVTAMPLTPTSRGLSSPENTERYNRTINQTAMVNANYNRKFGDHTISLFGGYEQYQSDYNYFQAYRKYYISDVIQTMDAGNSKDQTISGTATIYARKSYIGRASYDYKGKYLAEFVFRADASLKFPTSDRWGYFPALMVGWRASEEDFWKNNFSFVNYFKLRGSYGQMGSDPGNSFQYMDKYPISTGMTFGTGGSVETAVGSATVANTRITWERQTSYNLGFDSKFANDLFSLNAEFFYQRRDHILVAKNASVPNFTGLSLPQQNIGIVDNRGFELEGGYHKAINKDWRIDVSANFSYNHNKVVYMDEPATSETWQQLTGHSFAAWLMYDAIGIYKDAAQVAATPHVTGAKAGDVIFRDVSGDGTIDGDDRILFDKVDAPETYYGASVNVNYKAFSLTVQIQGTGKFLKNSQYDNRRGEAGNYYKWQYTNRWTSTNTNTNIARAYNRDDLYWSPDVRMSDYWLQNTAFCRLKNVVLNYTIPAKYYQKIGLNKATIYVTGNNLALLWSATKKWDPETNNPGVYPTMKTIAIGANITF
jgi:TonB-dependent starch-binding outer membrane protein SusC